jgi:hypothetical protein
MLDQTTLEIIKARPIGKGLDTFRSSFSSVTEELELSDSLKVLDQIDDKGNTSYHFTLLC